MSVKSWAKKVWRKVKGPFKKVVLNLARKEWELLDEEAKFLGVSLEKLVRRKLGLHD